MSQKDDFNQNDWVKIFSSPDNFKVQIIQGMLEEHDVKAVIMNKKDSAYGIFGEVEIYVLRENVLQAVNLIKNKEK